MQLKFMKYRKPAYVISVVLVALSIVALVFKGLSYGIDFAGGISMEVKSQSADYTIDKMRFDLAAFSPELQEFKDSGTVLVRVGLQRDSTEEQQNQTVREIKEILGDRVSYEQVQIVGPKI